ncbi:MAG: thiamine-monophosphate kinase [Chthoniobacterales bacterium]
MKLSQLGEDRLLAQLVADLPGAKSVVTGAGDDCALLKFRRAQDLFVLKTDCVVESVHFSPRASAVDVGWKAMMRPLSDFAAVSALPEFALITLIVPGTRSTLWVRQLYRGLKRAAARFKLAIVGGETSATPGAGSVAVAVVGFVERKRCVLRSGGKPGDDLFVTGRLGGALRRKHLRFIPRIRESRWLTENFRLHAMIDLSDGLGADLPRLARASKVAFKIDIDRLPVTPGCKIDNAISDGEDYELLFAISPRDRERLEKKWRKKFPRVPLTRIGSLNRQSAVSNQRLKSGYLHFK